MAIQNRTVSIKSVFAETANTTIPTPPAVGVSYRNENVTAAEIGEGWPYKEIVDSAKFNESMYEYTTICKQLETYGFLPWCPDTDYEAGGCALGTDGNVYQAKQATGPSTTARDPVSDTSHTYWDLFYYGKFTANRALASDADGKATATAVTSTELGYLSGVTSALQTQLNNLQNLITTSIRTTLSTIWPVGSLYIGTQTTCPMAALIPGSIWTLVVANKALWTGDGTNANTTIEAGLPNITGILGTSGYNSEQWSKSALLTGAFYKDTSLSEKRVREDTSVKSADYNFGFNASLSNSIYGNSTTVQPPAYVVNVWRRTA